MELLTMIRDNNWIDWTKEFVLQVSKRQYEKYSLKDKRILCIDDEQCFTELFDRFITTDEKAYVKSAFNGYEALEKYPLIKWDVVICDINMPGMNGWETLETIRKMSDYSVPIIMRSFFWEGHLIKSFYSGADFVMHGSVPIKELIATITWFIENYQQIFSLKNWVYGKYGIETGSHFLAMLQDISHSIHNNKKQEFIDPFNKLLGGMNLGFPRKELYNRIINFYNECFSEARILKSMYVPDKLRVDE